MAQISSGVRGTASLKSELTMTKPRAGRSVRILLSAACVALVLASCGDGGREGADEVAIPTQGSEASSPADSSAALQDDSTLSLEDAAAAALKEVGRSSLLTIETEDARTIWEATVVKRNGTEYEILIAKSDGSLFDGPTRKIDDAEDKAENRARIRAAKLDYKEAARKISDAVPDAKLMELNLESDDRLTVWEGDLRGKDGTRYSVTINAKSGRVLEKDADAEDDD
jgi:uncharacterized membrane protein YkoI